MKIRNPLARLARIFLAASILAAPLQAQTRRTGAQPRTPAKPVAREVAPTFETLLASDSFKVYGEIRGVGQLIRSQALNDLLDPVLKLSSPPKEFKTLVTWLNTHADQLVTSRLLFAAWPSRPKLPQFIAAIEFTSAEEAQKFEPRLRQFLPQIVPSPSPSPSPTAAEGNKPASEPAKPSSPPPPPYVIKQAGTLVLISTASFTFKNLRPANSRLLVEDPEFRQVRDRFASEQTFLYFDVKGIMKEEEEERLKRQQQYEEEQKKREAEVAQQQKDAEAIASAEVVSPDDGSPAMDPQPDPEPSPEFQVTTPEGTRTVGSLGPSPVDMAFSSLMGSFFTGTAKWPVAIGLGIALDNDSLNTKVLLVNPPDARSSVLPFIPQLVSGPHITPAAPSILPADTEMFATVSLDYGLMYDGMVKAHADMVQNMQKERLESLAKNPQTAISMEQEPVSPFASYERLLGIKIKDDLLPLLGNEIAISLPLTEMFKDTARPPASSESNPSEGTTAPEQKAKPAPIVAIAIKDRERVKILIPKVIESVGLKGAGLIAQTEKRDDTELISYANAFGYALVGDFLVVSTDVNAIRHVVDSYLTHETLGSNSRFRNSTRWQPRQVLGQFYVAETMSTVNGVPAGLTEINEQMRDLILRLSPYNEPMTYALYNEGLGPLHEVHIPKNLLVIFAAGFASGSSNMSLEGNESMAQAALHSIVGAQESYKATGGKGSYGTLDQLTSAGLISKEMWQDRGYKIDMMVSGARFEVRAVPLEYGKSGKRSFYVDETGILRAGDLGGGPATISDKPVQ
jgi:hypothetical protein